MRPAIKPKLAPSRWEWRWRAALMPRQIIQMPIRPMRPRLRCSSRGEDPGPEPPNMQSITGGDRRTISTEMENAGHQYCSGVRPGRNCRSLSRGRSLVCPHSRLFQVSEADDIPLRSHPQVACRRGTVVPSPPSERRGISAQSSVRRLCYGPYRTGLRDNRWHPPKPLIVRDQVGELLVIPFAYGSRAVITCPDAVFSDRRK